MTQDSGQDASVPWQQSSASPLDYQTMWSAECFPNWPPKGARGIVITETYLLCIDLAVHAQAVCYESNTGHKIDHSQHRLLERSGRDGGHIFPASLQRGAIDWLRHDATGTELLRSVK